MPADTPTAPLSARTLHLLLLAVCGGLLLFTGLGDMGLTDRDEGSNAEAAREMLDTGDWISPTLNGEPRYAKPAGTYWMTAGVYALFGVSEFTARLPSAAFGLALLLLHYLFLHRTLGPTVALCGSLMLLLNVEFVSIHRMALTDPALVLFTTLAAGGFWLGFHGRGRDRRFLWLFYIGMALATLAKGPVGLLIPLLGVAPYLTLTRQWPAYVARGRPLLGWAVCVLIAAPWYLAMLSIHGTEYLAAAQAHTLGRFANPMEGHGGTILFYVPVLLLGFFPWSGWLLPALVHEWRNWKSWWMNARPAGGEQGLLLFCAVWVAALFVFFSLSATRLPHYILPLYPPAALLAAVLCARAFTRTPPPGFTAATRIILVTGYLFSGLLVSVPLVYERMRPVIAEHFPAARQVGVGAAPVVMGVVVFLGVALFRHLVRRDARRERAFWTLAGMTGTLLLIVILFVLPRVGRYFINPPQQLAAVAGLNLAPDDALIHFGRKLPSLSFYAKRRVHFINPGEDEKFAPHAEADGRVMIILPTRLHTRLPASVSSFAPILQRYGVVLLSSDPMVQTTITGAPSRGDRR